MQMMKQVMNEKCIDSCFDCVEACEMCMTECTGKPAMEKCMQLSMDCADMCMVAGRMMSRGSMFSKDACMLCEKMCNACAAECEKHMDMMSSMKCAEACKACADECHKMSMK